MTTKPLNCFGFRVLSKNHLRDKEVENDAETRIMKGMEGFCHLEAYLIGTGFGPDYCIAM